MLLSESLRVDIVKLRDNERIRKMLIEKLSRGVLSDNHIAKCNNEKCHRDPANNILKQNNPS